MITTEQLIEIFAVQLTRTNPKLTVDEARSEVSSDLFADPDSSAALHSVAEAIWHIGHSEGRPRPLTAEQKVGIARRAFVQDGSLNVMQIIEQTQACLLEQYDE